MKIAIISNSIVANDAIGSDIEKMLGILCKKHECHVYGPYVLNKRIKGISRDKLLELISDESNLLIYHHSIFWDDVENILNKAKCKIAFKYHNITPPEYFKYYSKHYYDLCRSGREQTKRLSERYFDALWMPDSEFNSQDITAGKKEIIPPFNGIKWLSSLQPDDYILSGLLESNKINLLFVGRITPNKNHAFLFEILTDYIRNYGNEICLHVIGKQDGKLKSYFEELKYLVKKMDLKDNVKFAGEAGDRELLSYYLGCDFYVCGSDHEGFCVPIVEAQYFCLPVIAKRSSAVAETAGNGQLLLSQDPREYSAAIRLLTDDTGYLRYVVEKGYDNYSSRFDNDLIEEKFLRVLSEYTGTDL
ncbi:MAG: glycosyltransferase family 4 protein [Candidatus Margulisiibacteriota bacterium]